MNEGFDYKTCGILVDVDESPAVSEEEENSPADQVVNLVSSNILF